MKRLDEAEVIRIMSSALGIADRDDVAVIDLPDAEQLAFKADMLVASTDVPAQMKPWQVARKSLVACASDLACKGVLPVAAMISLGLPAGISRGYVEGLAKGFQAASQEFGVKIVGGDTNEAGDLVIDCSMVGAVTKGWPVPRRSGARPGDAVVVSGMFGYPAAGLVMLLGDRSIKTPSGQFRKAAVESVLEPRPRQEFGMALARYFSSSIDSSDGLAFSLYEIATQSSRVDIKVDYEKVRAAGVDEFAQANGLDPRSFVFFGGEEYEIIATIPKASMPEARAAAKKAGVALYEVGTVTKGAGRVYDGKSLLENRGYQHLARPR